jgi:hypothetical protein
MVRKDKRGVDFGIWKILIRNTCLFHWMYIPEIFQENWAWLRTQNDWKTVEELDTAIRKFDDKDPAKYDFALFGLGVTKELL